MGTSHAGNEEAGTFILPASSDVVMLRISGNERDKLPEAVEWAACNGVMIRSPGRHGV